MARFIPFGRTAVTFTAGYTKGLPWHRFFRYDLIAGGLWATYATMLGYIGGKQFEEQPWKGVARRARDRVLGRVRDRARPQVARQEGAARAVRSGSRVRIHVTGATGFLGSELARSRPGATGERVEIRDARRRAATCSSASGPRWSSTPPIARTATARGRSSSTAPRTSPARPRPSERGSSTSRPTSSSTAARERHTSRHDTPSPCTDYGHAKAEAEERVAAAAPGALLVRTSLIVGGPGHAPSKHELAARNPEATFFEDEIRSPVHVGDLAARCSSSQPSSFPGRSTSPERTTSRAPTSPSSSPAGPSAARRRRLGGRSTVRSTPRGRADCWPRGCVACARCFARGLSRACVGPGSDSASARGSLRPAPRSAR